jgi:glycogen debranching enzyme
MGPFITAYVKVNAGSESARRQAEAWLAPLRNHLSDAGLGHISEIFDGDPPIVRLAALRKPGAWQSYCGQQLRTSTEFDLNTRHSREELL